MHATDGTFRVVAMISAFNEGDVISRVIEHLVDNGVEISAVHNHLLRASPSVVYMHVAGHGESSPERRIVRNHHRIEPQAA